MSNYIQFNTHESSFQTRYCNTKFNPWLERYDPSEILRIYRPHTILTIITMNCFDNQ